MLKISQQLSNARNDLATAITAAIKNFEAETGLKVGVVRSVYSFGKELEIRISTDADDLYSRYTE